MNRRTKIIVSIAGVFVVLLALLGITYGYFLTRVVGNTNDKSISITTANLSLIYNDGTVNLLTKDNIIPGMTIASKDFTVRNNGTGYIDEYRVYLEDVINDFKYYEDVKLFITCTSKLKDGTEKYCNGYEGLYPRENSELIFNSIEVGETHSYELSVKYIETDSDQSDDMNKTIEGKVQIYVPEDVIAIGGSVNIANPVADALYYVEMQSESKTSQIVDGNYIIQGIAPGNHTIYVKYIDKDGNIETASTKTITVSKGTNPSISSDGTNIVINELSEKAIINVNANGSEMTTVGQKVETINNFEEGTLAYNILDKAINKTGLSDYYVNPIIGSTKTVTLIENITLTDLAQSGFIMSSNKDLIEKMFIGQDINEEFLNQCFIEDENGVPIPTNAEGCGDLNFYIGDNSLTCDKISNKYVTFLEGLHISRVKTCNADAVELEHEFQSKALLSKAPDDYGVSYYYKGNIQDNYVDFAGMCWRIVRIEGDGSTKLILEDQNGSCKNSSGNWAIPTVTHGITKLASYGISLHQNSQNSYVRNYLNSSVEPSMATAFKNFQTGPMYKYLDRLKSGNWCDVIENDTKSFRCMSDVMNDWDDPQKTPMYVGTINGAEFMYSLDDVVSFLGGDYWSLSSPLNRNGYLYSIELSSISECMMLDATCGEKLMRPSISLKPGIMIAGGTGTKLDAYIVN